MTAITGYLCQDLHSRCKCGYCRIMSMQREFIYCHAIVTKQSGFKCLLQKKDAVVGSFQPIHCSLTPCVHFPCMTLLQGTFLQAVSLTTYRITTSSNRASQHDSKGKYKSYYSVCLYAFLLGMRFYDANFCNLLQ